MKNYNDMVIIGLLVILIVGYLATIFAEILLLRKKGWVDGNLSITYPLITNGLAIPIAAIAYFIAGVVMMFLAFFVLPFVLPFIGSGIKDNRLDTVILIVYWLFSAVIMFLFIYAAFLLVRMITTMLMVKSSTLTLKYQAALAAIPASLIAGIYLLITIAPYLMTDNAMGIK